MSNRSLIFIFQKLRSCVALPFICTTTSNDTEVDCSISRDRSEYQLKFSSEFELHDDIEGKIEPTINLTNFLLYIVLARLGLTEATGADELLPNKLRHFLKTSSSKKISDAPQSSTQNVTSNEEIVILTQRDEQVRFHFHFNHFSINYVNCSDTHQ